MIVTPNHCMALSTSKYEIFGMWQPSDRAAIVSTTLTKNEKRFSKINLWLWSYHWSVFAHFFRFSFLFFFQWEPSKNQLKAGVYEFRKRNQNSFRFRSDRKHLFIQRNRTRI